MWLCGSSKKLRNTVVSDNLTIAGLFAKTKKAVKDWTSRTAEAPGKAKMKITDLAKSSTFDDFFEVISQTTPISRKDANEKYVLLRQVKPADVSRKPTRKRKSHKPTTTKVDYRRYINSKKWRTKRNSILARDGFKCTCCGSSDSLQVHHLTYARLGRENPSDLTTLCVDCHSNTHEADGKAFSRSTAAFMEIARQY